LSAQVGTGRAPRINVSEYPGRPVLKRPVWTWEVPAYFFVGGLAGASALLGLVADLAGQRTLARNARVAAAAGAAVSPALLLSDLGRPRRFANMLRVFRPTSPMNIGSWILTVFGGAAGIAALSDVTGRGRSLGRAAGAAAGLLGPALATYTAVLVGQTSVPVWERARTRLPALFASSAAASAGGLACVVTPEPHTRAARLLAVGGAISEVACARAMRRVLGDHEVVYRRSPAALYARTAEGLTLSGLGLVGVLGRRRWAAVAGGMALLGGSLCQRLAIWRAGPESAALTGTQQLDRVPASGSSQSAR
jgi:formate-dependent nitrite reductase membrane component NrfD